MLTVDQPTTITRDAYLSIIRAAGFEARDLVELRFTPAGIYATVRVTDDQGRVVADGDEVAKHTVFVRLVDIEDPAA